MGRGTSKAGKRAPYGTEFHSVHQSGNIKFVKPNDGATTAPMYTKTKSRIYATLDENDEVKYITLHGKTWKAMNEGYNRSRQIDIKGKKHKIDGDPTIPHTHFGYHHDKGTIKPTKSDQKLMDKVLTEWYNYKHRQ